jgi:hypothetical protein
VEPFKRLVDVVHGEHDAEVALSVHRGFAVICDDRRREEAGEFEPAVAIRRARWMGTVTFPSPWSSGSQLFSMSPNH